MLLQGRLGLVDLVIRGHVYNRCILLGVIELRVTNYNNILE